MVIFVTFFRLSILIPYPDGSNFLVPNFYLMSKQNLTFKTTKFVLDLDCALPPFPPVCTDSTVK